MKKTKKSFFKIMLIYGAILAAIILVGLLVLLMFTADYENTRPNTVITNYIQSLDADDMRSIAGNTVSKLNHSLMSEDECYNYIRQILEHFQLSRAVNESDSQNMVYYIQTDNITLGRILLQGAGNTLFGFQAQTVSQAEFDFSPLCGETTVCVPENWTVSCQGELTRENEKVPYQLLEEFYDDEDLTLPHLVEYSTGLYLEEPQLLIQDPAGNSYEHVDEAMFYDNCTQQQKEEISQFAEEFLLAYVRYSSNSNRNVSGNYFALEKLMVMGSTLQKRMRYAVAGLGWASSNGDELSGIEYNHYMDLGGGSYLCDLTYTVDTLGSAGLVTTNNKLKLIIVQNPDGGYLAQAMSSY